MEMRTGLLFQTPMIPVHLLQTMTMLPPTLMICLKKTVLRLRAKGREKW